MPHEHTTSINRSYSDLDQGKFLCYVFAFCALRTAAQQPLNLALARKQTCCRANAMSSLSVLRGVYRHEGGLRSLSRGMAAMTVGCAVSEVIYLGLFEYAREQLPFASEVTRDAAAGYGADATCRIVHIPLSIVAFRQMTAGSWLSTTSSRVVHQNAAQTLRGMYRERGLRSVFAGYGTTLAIGCQWSAAWWALYAVVKSALYRYTTPYFTSLQSERAEDRWLPAWCTATDDNMGVNAFASVVTSATTAVVFNPYLVVRTNLQVTPRATLVSATSAVYHARGFAGFFSGLALSIGTCIVDGALASMSYEYAKLWADRTRSSTTGALAPTVAKPTVLVTS